MGANCESFQSAADKFWERFDRGLEIVLATSADNIVTARTVSAIALNGKVYFLTFEGSTKLAQIRQNPSVAMCHFDLHMRGTAKILGGLEKSESAAAHSALRAAFPKDMEMFGQIPGVVLVEVVPAAGGFGRVSTGGMFILDFETKTASRI